MARWKLACSHYLNTVKPAKWRYNETDTARGETIEQEFVVPRMLDVHDPKCWTNRWGGIDVAKGGNSSSSSGEIIVCMPGKGAPGDIEFLGDPTPDMLPQDEEAEEISAGFQDRWAYKPEPEVPFTQSLVDRSKFEPAPVEIAGMSELVQSLAALTSLMAAQQPQPTKQPFNIKV